KSLTTKSVLLMDGHFMDGDIPLFLDMKPEHGFAAIVRDLNRLDATFLQSLLSSHASGLSLLPVGAASLPLSDIPPSCVAETVDLLGSAFDYVVVDGGSGVHEVSRPIFERALCIVVTTICAPMIRKAKFVLDELRRMEIPDDRIQLAITRYTARAGAPLKETEAYLGKSASWLIPDDYPLVCRSINEGIPLTTLAPRAKVTKAIHAMAQRTLRTMGEPKPLSRFAKLVKRLVGERPQSMTPSEVPVK
ncbi:MAG: hypothetical protein D6704_07715, partial [Nitrospirae bacterium]